MTVTPPNSDSRRYALRLIICGSIVVSLGLGLRHGGELDRLA